MNPSYDNGFGSFGSGGTAPGMGNGVGGAFGSGGPSGAGGASGMAFTGAGLSSGESGDVIIGGGAPAKKSRKGVVIGIAVVLVVLIVGGIAAVMAMSSGSWGGNNEGVRDKFNKLINYVVSGEASTSDYDEAFSDEASYYFDTQQANLENRETLYATAGALLDDFMNSYSSLADKSQFSSDAEQFEEIMNSEKDALILAKAIGTKPLPTIYDILNVYEEETTLAQRFSDYYDFSGIEDNAYMNEFKSVFEKYIDAQSRRIELYQDKDCISGSTIRNNCIVEGDTLAAEYEALINELKAKWAELEDYYDVVSLFTVRLLNANELLSDDAAAFVWRGSYA